MPKEQTDQSFTKRDQKLARGSEGRMRALLTVACPSILLLSESHVGNNLFLTPAIHLLKRIFPALTLDIVLMSQRGAGIFGATLILGQFTQFVAGCNSGDWSKTIPP